MTSPLTLNDRHFNHPLYAMGVSRNGTYSHLPRDVHGVPIAVGWFGSDISRRVGILLLGFAAQVRDAASSAAHDSQV
jgi:hypothetical protein